MNFQTSVSPLRFWKMQGCGNNFVVSALSSASVIKIDSHYARSICARHTGVGSDGILIVSPPSVPWADFDVLMRNPDGSLMGMCGNGIRCVARYVHSFDAEKIAHTFNVEGKAIKTKLFDTYVSVDMGAPSFDPADIGLGSDSPFIETPFVIDGEKLIVTAVAVPNPHAVIFIDEPLPRDVFLASGPRIETDPVFHNRTNVEFVTVRSRCEVDVDVWERGAGPTLACGTAACAVVVAGIKTDRLDSKVTVHLPGGAVTAEWNLDANTVILEGPAMKVYEGEYTYAI